MAAASTNIIHLFLGILFIAGVNCSSTEDDGLEGITSYHVIFGVFLLGCFIALLALCGGEVAAARPAPSWIMNLHIDPEVDKGLTGCSDGFTVVSPTCVKRHRTGGFETDGAKWGAPLSTGKHVFEIHWDKDERGLFATVGVGSDQAELFVKPRGVLVGKDRFSWGYDIARRKLVHRGTDAANVPGWYMKGFVPEKFYMYVDCDSGTLGFGSDLEFWGAPHNIPRDQFPVYPMIGCMCHNAEITMIYRGSENKNGQGGQMNSVAVVDADGNPVPGASNYQSPPGAGYPGAVPGQPKEKKDKKPKNEVEQAAKLAKKGFKAFDKFINN